MLFRSYRAVLVAQLVKNPPVIQETPVQFLGWEDLLEKGQATHSSVIGPFPIWNQSVVPCPILTFAS